MLPDVGIAAAETSPAASEIAARDRVTPGPVAERGATRERLRRAQLLLVPLGAIFVLVGLIGAGARPLLVVGIPVVALGAAHHRLPRAVRAATALLAGVVAFAGGLIAREPFTIAAGVLFLVAGACEGWGANRGRSRARAWRNRALALVAGLVLLIAFVYPSLLTIDYLAKPRSPVHESALGLQHEDVSFRASDGVRLSGWYAPGQKGAAIVLVHGGGGDREGVVRHARMLAGAGYGVLLYDARGRGRSEGHENAFGWRWHRDVRGAVDYLRGRGVHRIGLLGLSTGAEAVVTEAAGDPRVRAVVADGLQGRTVNDASHLAFGDRVTLQPAFAVVGAELRLVRGEKAPPPLLGLVHRLAATRPLLLIGTESFERALQRAYARGTKAQLWELPHTPHTRGLAERPVEYRRRVLALFRPALGAG